jgi:hypothetical protein
VVSKDFNRLLVEKLSRELNELLASRWVLQQQTQVLSAPGFAAADASPFCAGFCSSRRKSFLRL